MPSILQNFKCDVCGHTYGSLAEALACEQREVVGVKKLNSGDSMFVKYYKDYDRLSGRTVVVDNPNYAPTPRDHVARATVLYREKSIYGTSLEFRTVCSHTELEVSRLQPIDLATWDFDEERQYIMLRNDADKQNARESMIYLLVLPDGTVVNIPHLRNNKDIPEGMLDYETQSPLQIYGVLKRRKSEYDDVVVQWAKFLKRLPLTPERDAYCRRNYPSKYPICEQKVQQPIIDSKRFFNNSTYNWYISSVICSINDFVEHGSPLYLNNSQQGK